MLSGEKQSAKVEMQKRRRDGEKKKNAENCVYFIKLRYTINILSKLSYSTFDSIYLNL